MSNNCEGWLGMKIKMVVVDMDGTFLNDQNTYNQQRFMELFEQLKRQQIKFVVASGSQFQRLQGQFASVKDNLDFISQNGALVHHGHELIAAEAINERDLQQALQLIAREFTQNYMMQTTISGVKKTYVDRQTPMEVLQIIKRYYYAVELVDDFFAVTAAAVHDQITKIGVTFADPNNYQTLVNQLRTKLPATLASQNSGFNTELIGNAGVDKVTGINRLQERYGIASDQIMTFGDNENDLKMLQMTPYGFAMQNATAQFKQQVNNVTQADNNHDGVLATIQQMIE